MEWNGIPLRVIRRNRKTVQLRFDPQGVLEVRAPWQMGDGPLLRLLDRHALWIRRHHQQALRRPEPSPEQRQALLEQARRELPERVAFYARRMGVTPRAVTITGARTRFGSCSGDNRLSFSWRLMQYPPEARDYVVVHELAHIRYHNHGPDFYAFLASVLPDHLQRRKLLRS